MKLIKHYITAICAIIALIIALSVAPIKATTLSETESIQEFASRYVQIFINPATTCDELLPFYGSYLFSFMMINDCGQADEIRKAIFKVAEDQPGDTKVVQVVQLDDNEGYAVELRTIYPNGKMLINALQIQQMGMETVNLRVVDHAIYVVSPHGDRPAEDPNLPKTEPDDSGCNDCPHDGNCLHQGVH